MPITRRINTYSSSSNDARNVREREREKKTEIIKKNKEKEKKDKIGFVLALFNGNVSVIKIRDHSKMIQMPTHLSLLDTTVHLFHSGTCLDLNYDTFRFFAFGATAPSGPGAPHPRGF